VSEIYACESSIQSQISIELKMKENMLSSHVRIAVSLVYIISSSVAGIFVPAILAQSPGQATVIVKVTGLRSEKGQVRIAVFNSSEK
jgi:uncharacterized protein (DUF2141 family)